LVFNRTKSFTIDSKLVFFTTYTKTFGLDAKLVFAKSTVFTIDAWTSYKEQIYQMQADITDLKANGVGGGGDVTVGTLYGSDGIKNW